jgi:hypothetical protein
MNGFISLAWRAVTAQHLRLVHIDDQIKMGTLGYSCLHKLL